jgi:hypothetical protein
VGSEQGHHLRGGVRHVRHGRRRQGNHRWGVLDGLDGLDGLFDHVFGT